MKLARNEKTMLGGKCLKLPEARLIALEVDWTILEYPQMALLRLLVVTEEVLEGSVDSWAEGQESYDAEVVEYLDLELFLAKVGSDLSVPGPVRELDQGA